MRKTIVALVALFPLSTFAAAATWANVSGASRSRVATCASGTCDAPSAATDGINLNAVASVAVRVCAASGQTITGGSVTFYYYDAADALWAETSQTYTLATGTRCSEVTGDSPGRGIPMLVSAGRLAPKMDATVSSGGATMTVRAADVDGDAR